MTNADRLVQLNRWYDSVPEMWQNHIILWPLVGAGFLNMQLTFATGFPFGLLVLLTIAGYAVLRLPERIGWVKQGPDGARFEIGQLGFLYGLNRLYDSVPELPRFAIFPLILIVAGTLNMWLTYHHGWPFGSLLLLALLALIAFRLPYHWKVIPVPAQPEQVSPQQMLQAWAACATGWFRGLPHEARFWVTLACGFVLIGFDIIVTGGGRTGMSVLVAIELLAAIVLMAVEQARGSYVNGATTLREQLEVLKTLMPDPNGPGFRSSMLKKKPAHSEPQPAQRTLSMEPSGD